MRHHNYTGKRGCMEAAYGAVRLRATPAWRVQSRDVALRSARGARSPREALVEKKSFPQGEICPWLKTVRVVCLTI
jgi:hypothetical protein